MKQCNYQINYKTKIGIGKSKQQNSQPTLAIIKLVIVGPLLHMNEK